MSKNSSPTKKSPIGNVTFSSKTEPNTISTKKLEYKTMDQRSHVLHRPGMYIGSTKPARKEMYVAERNDEDEKNEFKITKKEIEYIPGLDRIFIEILSNAVDNVWRSREFEVDATKIKININPQTGETRVWNDGMYIECEKNPDTKLYNVEMIFGKLLSGSNYNDEEERKTAGLNGLGCKLSSIFSTKFCVKTVDPKNGKIYEQTWEDNMSKRNEPDITSTKSKQGSTEVVWTPDFARFGCKGYSDDMLSIIYKHVIDAAMITKIGIYLNDEKIPVKTLSDYAKLYINDDKIQTITLESTDCEAVLMSNTDEKSEYDTISFVNGIETFDGGVHVDVWTNALIKPVLEKINSSGKKDTPQLVMKDIKPFFKLFVNASVDKPEFSSQEKTKLTAPSVKTSVDTKNINTILKWNIIENIKDIIRGKELLTLKKTEKKKGFKKIEGYDPANNSGGKESMDCTLILCEGLSAKTYAVMGIEIGAYGKKSRDYFGIYPLRGKVLNTRNANISTIAKNREITDIIQALGLRYGVDYTDEENFKTLNYGKLMLLTDADDDGIHISGLVINFIHSLFPSLIKREESFVITMKTPIIRIYFKNKDIQFYSSAEYTDYIKKNPDHKGRIKYFKGLGTSNDKEIRDSFGKKIVEYIEDEKTDENINKVFHTKFSNQRKEWLESYDPDAFFVHSEGDDSVTQMSFSDFIDTEMIKFSIDDCKRSIPNLMDGLKESHRKILYACFLKNLKTTGKTLKVAQLAGFVAEKTNYHHGEQCLFDTITKMAHDFPGSNNIPYLFRDGQMGSRAFGGKDAASARYIFTKLESLTRLLFKEEDDPILTKVEDDGEIVEPVFYVPIIPTILINGSEGIGTGWSCSVPCYNPLDLVKCVKIWLEKKTVFEDEEKTFSLLPEIYPWYKGFNGKVEKVSDNKFMTTGIIKEEKGNKVVVSELPVGLWTEKFKEHVEDLLEDKKIKGYKNYSTPDLIQFQIQETTNGLKCNVDNLKLKTSITTSNMVLFTDKGTLKKYNSVDEIIDDFCKVRYDYYILRKKCILSGLTDDLKWVQNKFRFLKEVMDEELIISKRDEEDITADLESRGYDKKGGMVVREKLEDELDEEEKQDGSYRYLLDMKIRSFTKQKLEELQKEIDNLEKNIQGITKTTESEMWLEDLDHFEKAYNSWLSVNLKKYNSSSTGKNSDKQK